MHRGKNCFIFFPPYDDNDDNDDGDDDDDDDDRESRWDVYSYSDESDEDVFDNGGNQSIIGTRQRHRVATAIAGGVGYMRRRNGRISRSNRYYDYYLNFTRGGGGGEGGRFGHVLVWFRKLVRV